MAGTLSGARPLLRQAGSANRSHVSMVELFFDLVFVFAVTQLSHTLLAHLTLVGALQVGMLFLGMWWVWISTSWVTNWVDPDHHRARLMLFALMLGGLLLSSLLPEAFGAKGLAFGVVFAVVQVSRSVFMMFSFGGPSDAHGRNFLRISAWTAAAGACWILGGLADPTARLAWWAVALAFEYTGPLAYFAVPGLGRSSTADWDIDPHHMAERCALFVIIALGESLLVTGTTFSNLPWDATHVAAFLAAFIGAVTMWWLYFDTGSQRGAHHFSHAADVGRVARLAYTYLHLMIVGGIIVCAVADELVLAHPAHATGAGVAAILGGPALYLLGNALFKWVTNARRLPPLSHMVGVLLLAGLAPFGFAHVFSALVLGCLSTAILFMVAVWETVAVRRPAPS